MATENMTYRLRDVADKIETLHKNGITKGLYLGFENLHEKFSWKMKSTTYIYGSPFAGKSELVFEIALNLSMFYGLKHAFYSPESGEAQDIYAELVSKYQQKPFYKNQNNPISDSERFAAQAFIDEHFFIIDPKFTDLSIEEFYKQVDEIETKYETKINCTWCDPFNELKHDFSDDSGRQDLYIENRLGFIRRNAMAHDRHNVILTHCRDQQYAQTKDGKRYYPAPSPREIAGGQAWYRKAMNMLCMWRPPKGLNDENGRPFAENEVHIMIHKYKPKGVGELGTVKLFLDKERNRYYEYFNDQVRFASNKRPAPPEDTISIPHRLNPNYRADENDDEDDVLTQYKADF